MAFSSPVKDVGISRHLINYNVKFNCILKSSIPAYNKCQFHGRLKSRITKAKKIPLRDGNERNRCTKQ